MKKISHMIFQILDLPEIQKQIKTLCLGKSGVYKITNLENNKCYIGSACTKTPKGNQLYFRFRNHFFNHHKPFPLKRAVLKYGIHRFSWQILEFTPLETTRSREDFYIKLLKPEYNILEMSSIGYLHTAETRQKMKRDSSYLRRQRLGLLNRGKKLERDVVEKLARAAQSRTPEQKRLHREACRVFNQKTFSKPTQILDGETGQVLGLYPSLIAACRAWNGEYRTFKRAVKSGIKISKFNIYVKYSS